MLLQGYSLRAAVALYLLMLAVGVRGASLNRLPRQIPPANLQLYAMQGAYSPEFMATPATVITGWNNRTVNISSILAAAGPFGWPDKAVAFCESKCLNWTSCRSFDIDVKKALCYLSATRARPTHQDGNAALWTRISDFNKLKATNWTSQFDQDAEVLARRCAKQCSDWSECRSFDFIWNLRVCHLSRNATAPRSSNNNGILFVRNTAPCAVEGYGVSVTA